MMRCDLIDAIDNNQRHTVFGYMLTVKALLCKESFFDCVVVQMNGLLHQMSTISRSISFISSDFTSHNNYSVNGGFPSTSFKFKDIRSKSTTTYCTSTM